MSIPWNDEPYLAIYLGGSGDYMEKQQITPYSESAEAAYAQWAANWQAKGGTRRSAVFIIPKTEAEALPGQLTKWETEARDIGLKNGAEYNDMVYTMARYYPGINEWTESTRKGVWITMAQMYDTYRDEVVDAGGVPDNITVFTTAVMTSPEAWAKLQAEAGPLVASLRAEARKKKKDRRKKRLMTLVAIIAVVAFAIFLGPAIVSGAQSVIGGGTSVVSTLTTLPATATTGLTAALTSLGIPAAAASALTAGAVEAIASGAKKDDVSNAVADVAMDYVPDASSRRPTLVPSAGLSTPVIIGIAAVGLTAAGLIAYLILKKKG